MTLCAPYRMLTPLRRLQSLRRNNCWMNWRSNVRNRNSWLRNRRKSSRNLNNINRTHIRYAWWRHQMEIFSAILAICAGNSPVTGEFHAQRPVMQSFDVFFVLCLNKRLSKQSWGRYGYLQERDAWRASVGFCMVQLKPHWMGHRLHPNLKMDVDEWMFCFDAVMLSSRPNFTVIKLGNCLVPEAPYLSLLSS